MSNWLSEFAQWRASNEQIFPPANSKSTDIESHISLSAGRFQRLPDANARTGGPPITQWMTSMLCTACSVIWSPDSQMKCIQL